MSESGRWVEIDRTPSASGAPRMRYRACICFNGVKTRKRFKTEEEARAWLKTGAKQAYTRKIGKINWDYEFQPMPDSIYGRESVWS